MKERPLTLQELGRIAARAVAGDALAAVWLLQHMDLEAALERMQQDAQGRRCATLH